jgi:transketolase C-terminal domain/subunit
MSLAKGYKLADSFPNLVGDGKITRHINIKTIQDIDEKYIKDIICETLILNMEEHELKKLKNFASLK